MSDKTGTQCCSCDGCEKPLRRGSGYCAMHYWRLRRTGTLAGIRPVISLAERFARHTPTRPQDGCWVWTGTRQTRQDGCGGYGVLSRQTPMIYAHRYSYEQTHGPIPEGLLVRHMCDNPPCVNPAHLLVGTAQDNINDKIERGRQPRGQTHCCARLTEADVLSIRAQATAGRGPTLLAKEFGVARTTVQAIVEGRTWRHLLDARAS